ncbi:MAG: hypothetical protein NC184_05710 [Roseburia sp.]|nr:hypothetical protein [Ruminococcus flavefaciens]MCM1368284.1 hypothetical protein [Roseburia sp.]
MKKLIIEIKQTSGSSKKSDADATEEKDEFQDKVKDGVGKLSNPVGAIKSSIEDFAGAKGLAVAGAVITVAQQVLGQVSASVNFAVSGVGMTTGDSSLQERIAREQEKVQETVSMAKSIVGGAAAGAIMGAAFGPVGAIVGAVGGAIFGGVSTEIDKERKYEERRREYEYDAWKLDTARAVNLSRSGVTIGNGRLHQF